MNEAQPCPGLFTRVGETQRERIGFTLDGQELQALRGDTIMTALLTQRSVLRQADFSATARAGFCLMGACQDCWVSSEGGARYRACSTLLEPGMRLLTKRESAA